MLMEVSVFRNFWDKEPRGSTLEAMVEAIRSDERTRELTTGYRQQHLDALKNESMLFAVPCIFEGGKAQKQVVRLTTTRRRASLRRAMSGRRSKVAVAGRSKGSVGLLFNQSLVTG